MPDYSGYRQFSIKTDRYFQILEEWKKNIKPLTKQSFTEWITQTIESGLLRQRLVTALYPDFSVVATANTFIIERKEPYGLVKVFLSDKKIDCSATQNKEDYIIFACLHPLFNL